MTPLVNKELIDATLSFFSFNHDRVQEAVYSLVPEDRKPIWHYRIGAYLFSKLEEGDVENKLFYIVDQLNLGAAVIKAKEDDDMRLQLVRLNLKAGRKAKVSGAYNTAFSYFEKGLSLLGKDGWEKTYGLSLELYDETAEMCCLVQHYDKAETLIEMTLEKAHSSEDKVNAYILRIQLLSFQNKPREAVGAAIPILGQYGVHIPSAPKEIGPEIGRKYALIKEMLGEKDIRTFFLEKPIDESGTYYPASRILAVAGTAAYNTDKGIFLLIVLQGILIHARSKILKPLAAFGFAGFGIAVCSVFEDIDAGYQYGRLGLELLKYPSAFKVRARSSQVFYTLIAHYKTHRRKLIPHHYEIYQIGVENGDFQYAALSIAGGETARLFSGTELTELKHHIEVGVKAIAELDQKLYLNHLLVYFQLILNLMGTRSDHRITGDIYDETKMIPLHEKKSDLTALSKIYFSKMWLCYLFENYEEAMAMGELAMTYIAGEMSSIAKPQNYFYYALSILSVLDDDRATPMGDRKREEMLDQVDAVQLKMKKWADYGPMNYLHKYHLIKAEKASVLGKVNDAQAYYELAIEGAKDNEYTQEEAVACERYARYFISQGKEEQAKKYMRRAYACYSRWGAVAKISHMERHYARLIQKFSDDSESSQLYGVGSGHISADVDLLVIIKTAHALSSEMDLGKLLTQIMKLSLECRGGKGDVDSGKGRRG